jgi:Putative restriction endonuclease
MAVIEHATKPLVDGQRLTVDEFLRRWEQQPSLKLAELIEGVVYLPSPVGSAPASHHALTAGWVVNYAARTPGCAGGSEGTWLMHGSAPQADVHLRILPEYGGQSHDEKGLSVGAPELAVEVSGSSARLDLGPKRDLYAAAGVREYVVVLIGEGRVLWLRLEDGAYREIAPDADGILRSHVFPGLWLDPKAPLDHDAARLIDVVDLGLRSPEHGEFVKKLESSRIPK